MPQVDRSAQRDHVLPRWRRLHSEIRRRGERLAIFGAGQHTRWLLSEIVGSDSASDIVAILDDKAEQGAAIGNIPILKPSEADLSRIQRVVISSDRFESVLARRCKELFTDRVRVHRFYRGRRFITENGRAVAVSRWAPLASLWRSILFFPERRWGVAGRYLRAYFLEERRRFWHSSPSPPHWADHRGDAALWPIHRDPSFVERGIYSREVMRPGCRVLDLCCGDGFYAYYFYSTMASQIDAVDHDEAAIASARRHHAAANIGYSNLDVVADPFPAKRYDVVCWDGAIAHFNAEQIDDVLHKISDAVGEHGVLTGSEELEMADAMSWDHKVSLACEDDLRRILSRNFRHIRVLVVHHPRRMAYFRCSRDPSSLGGLV